MSLRVGLLSLLPETCANHLDKGNEQNLPPCYSYDLQGPAVLSEMLRSEELTHTVIHEFRALRP